MNDSFLSKCGPEIQDAAEILANNILPEIRDVVYQAQPHCRIFHNNRGFRKRVETFYNPVHRWKSTDNLSANPPELAEAGFHYNGFQDLVECYICGHLIGGWAKNQVTPWEAHCAWSPSCPFVRIHHPSYFIEIQRSRVAKFFDKFHFQTFCEPITHDNEELTSAQHQVFPLLHFGGRT